MRPEVCRRRQYVFLSQCPNSAGCLIEPCRSEAVVARLMSQFQSGVRDQDHQFREDRGDGL